MPVDVMYYIYGMLSSGRYEKWSTKKIVNTAFALDDAVKAEWKKRDEKARQRNHTRTSNDQKTATQKTATEETKKRKTSGTSNRSDG